MSKKEPVKTNIFATISFYLGLFDLIELFISFANLSNIGVVVGVALGSASIVLGIIALKQIKDSRVKMDGKYLAITGIILGVIAVLALPFDYFVWMPKVQKVLQELSSSR
jgi:hypothetical protein